MCTGTPATRVGDNMRSFAIVRGDCSGDWNDPDAWTWTPVVGDQADGAKYTFGIDPARTRAAACNLCIYDGYLYIGEYNDEEIPLEELMFSQDFGFLARNLEQSVNLYRMSIGADGTEQMELVVGEPTEMFPAGGILCQRSGFGDYENQYFWQSKVFDGKLFLGTFDTSSLLEPLGQFTNGDLLHMSRDEWASQIGYLKVLLKLLLNQDKNGDGTLLAADADTDAAIDAAVDAVNEEADSPETFSLTDAQYDTLRQGIDDGAYAAAYSVSTLGSLRRLNSLLAKLTDLVETNDIAGFVDIYQQACDLYSGISDKLPEALKKLYDALVRITELENMKDLVICLNKLSTATRGFGLYTITSENGKLTLDTLTRDGFGDPFNHGLRAFAVNDEQGWMVIGTANPFMGTVATARPDVMRLRSRKPKRGTDIFGANSLTTAPQRATSCVYAPAKSRLIAVPDTPTQMPPACSAPSAAERSIPAVRPESTIPPCRTISKPNLRAVRTPYGVALRVPTTATAARSSSCGSVPRT